MTLHKVAEKAGVSPVTARKALNNDPSVRHYLRARVLAIARQLDYNPNLIARGLRHGNANLAPLTVLGINDYWHGTLSQRLAWKLAGNGLEPMLCYDAAHMLRVCKSFRARGCLLASGVEREQVAELARGRRLVTIGSYFPELAVANLALDMDTAYRSLTLRLLADGRRRVAVVSNAYLLALEGGWPASKFPAVLRTLEEAGLQPAGGNVFRTAAEFGAWLERGGKKARGRGRLAANPVDAVLCEDDATAARVVGEMANRGMRTPSDALVVGCDAWLMLPGTWSVRLEPDVVAGMAAGLLRKALETDGAVESLTYTPGLATEAFQTEEDFQRLPRAEKLKT